MIDKIPITCKPTGNSAKLNDLHIIQGNFKELTTENYQKLKKSIIKRGFFAPFHVWKNNGVYNLCDGTQRKLTLLKMREEGYQLPPEYPIVIIEAKSLQDALDRILAISSQYGTITNDGLYQLANEAEIELEQLEKEFKFDAIDFDEFEKEFADIEKDQERDEKEDQVPEVEKKDIVKRGDVWLLGEHRLMCGDSTAVEDVEKLMNGEKADIVYTDPPYGVNIVSKQYGDGKVHGNGVTNRGNFKPIANDETTDLAKEFYHMCINLGFGKLIIWGANYFTDFLPPSRCWFTWYKKEDLPTDNFADSELAYCSEDKNCKVFPVKWRGMIKQGEEGQKRVHPTQKPIMLAEKCFDYVGCGAVFDGFLGSGSTLIACEKTNRKCYGMELDEHYCSVIIERFQEYSGKEAVRESDGVTYNSLSEV